MSGLRLQSLLRRCVRWPPKASLCMANGLFARVRFQTHPSPCSSLLPRLMTCSSCPQADAAHEGEADKQPFLIWEDRGGGEASHAAGMPSEDDEPDEALPEVIAAIIYTATSLCLAMHDSMRGSAVH